MARSFTHRHTKGRDRTYLKFFDTENDAIEWCVMKNKTSLQTVYAVVDGPEDNYAVVDLKTAIDMDQPYQIHYDR